MGTTDEQFEGHMKQAGPIHKVEWITKGKAIVVYKKKASVAKAAALDNTTIDGNERFINVKTGSDGGKGEGRKPTDSRDDDPSGSGRVLVMGMDFGTTDEQFEGHMKQAGPIHKV